MTSTPTSITDAAVRAARKADADAAARAAREADQHRERLLGYARKLAGRTLPELVAGRLEWHLWRQDDPADAGPDELPVATVGTWADLEIRLVYRPRMGASPERFVVATLCEAGEHLVPVNGRPTLEQTGPPGSEWSTLGRILDRIGELPPADRRDTCLLCLTDDELEELLDPSPEPGPDDELAAAAELDAAIVELFGRDALRGLRRAAQADPVAAAVLYLAGRVDAVAADTHRIAAALERQATTEESAQ